MDQAELKELEVNKIKFAHFLVNPNKEIRDKTLLDFKKHLSNTKAIDDMGMLKIWKALYYSMWLCDKQEIQQELATSLAGMVDIFETDALSLLYIRQFFAIILREWFVLDQHRINKMYTLIRMMTNKALLFVSSKPKLIQKFTTILEEEVLTKIPNGIRFHMTDIYLEELSSATNRKVSSKAFMELVHPFVKVISTIGIDKTFVDRVYNSFFMNYLDETQTSDKDEEKFPKVDLKVLQKTVFDVASEESTHDYCRKRLYLLHTKISGVTGVAFVESVQEEGEDEQEDEDNQKGKKSKKRKTIDAPPPPPAAAVKKSLKTKETKETKEPEPEVKKKSKEEPVSKKEKVSKKTPEPEAEVPAVQASKSKSKPRTQPIDDEPKEKEQKKTKKAKTDSSSEVPAGKDKGKEKEQVKEKEKGQGKEKDKVPAAANAPFIASQKFTGAKKGYVFQTGRQGTGFYLNVLPVVTYVRQSKGAKRKGGR